MTDDRIERRLAAILAADVAGYSRLTGLDEEGTHIRLRERLHGLADTKISEHHGKVVKYTGDGMLAEFGSVVDAVRCAIEVQRGMAEQNATVPQVKRIEFRIGIHVGDIIIDQSDIFGDAVNIAVRLEGIAETGGVCISDDAYRQVRGKVDIAFEDLGLQKLKNIAEPMHAWRMQFGSVSGSAAPDKSFGASSRPLALPDNPSIAVLPFTNMSSDPEQEYFTDGIAEDILSALSRVRWLFVIARQSSFSYKGRPVDIKRIGLDLGVRYIVEGSIRKAGRRVRVTAQLIDAETDIHIWADRFERDLGDIFALQDEITEQIVAAVEPSVQAIEIRRARAKPTDSLTAYDLYLRALPDFHAQTEEEVKRAEGFLRKAIEIDPTYAEALGTLADCIAVRTLNGWHESFSLGAEEACQVADRALAVGPDNSTCVASAAFAYAILARRFDEAWGLADRALVLYSNSVFVRNRAGAVYANCGDPDRAIIQYEAARRMNPLDRRKAATFTLTGLAYAHFFARRFETCVHSAKHALAITANTNIARRVLAAALAHLGRIEEARAEIAELIVLDPGSTLKRSRLASYRHDWMHELYVDGLRKAGLPEG